MILVITASAAAAALLGGLGIVNYLNGNALRASAALVLPIYLCYWAWQARDNLADEPLILVYAAAWLVGIPVGLAVHAVRIALA